MFGYFAGKKKIICSVWGSVESGNILGATLLLPFCCMPAPAPNKKLNGTIHSIFNSIVTHAVSRKMNVIVYIFEIRPPHVTCSVHFQTSCQTHRCSRCPYHSRPMLRSQEPENLKPKVGNTKGAI